MKIDVILLPNADQSFNIEDQTDFLIQFKKFLVDKEMYVFRMKVEYLNEDDIHHLKELNK